MATVAVIGSGAIGAYYGGRLALAGHDVRFLVRSDLAAWRAGGLRVFSQAVSGRGHTQPGMIVVQRGERPLAPERELYPSTVAQQRFPPFHHFEAALEGNRSIASADSPSATNQQREELALLRTPETQRALIERGF